MTKKSLLLNKIVYIFIVVILGFCFCAGFFAKPVAAVFVKSQGYNKSYTGDLTTNQKKQMKETEVHKENAFYCLYLNDFNADCDIEHIVPTSWFIEENKAAAKHDYFNTRVAFRTANAFHGNKKYGEVNHATAKNEKYGNKILCWYNDEYFEPCDESKGDIARAVLYVCCRYGMFGHQNIDVSLMIKWARLDPVDAYEKHHYEKAKAKEGYHNLLIIRPSLVNAFVV